MITTVTVSKPTTLQFDYAHLSNSTVPAPVSDRAGFPVDLCYDCHPCICFDNKIPSLCSSMGSGTKFSALRASSHALRTTSITHE